MSSEINDKRTKDDFKQYTFSKYKKSLVKDQLTKSLYESKIEASCYWCAELICSGHYAYLPVGKGSMKIGQRECGYY